MPDSGKSVIKECDIKQGGTRQGIG